MTDMNDIDIVERLRDSSVRAYGADSRLCAEAADAIETGRREIKDLRRKVQVASEQSPWAFRRWLVGEVRAARTDCADAIETGRQWETIARRAQVIIEEHGLEGDEYAYRTLQMIRVLADRAPTPTDGG